MGVGLDNLAIAHILSSPHFAPQPCTIDTIESDHSHCPKSILAHVNTHEASDGLDILTAHHRATLPGDTTILRVSRVSERCDVVGVPDLTSDAAGKLANRNYLLGIDSSPYVGATW